MSKIVVPQHLYLKQIELGPLMNFIYLIGSKSTREVAVVDPAWDVPEILRIAQEDDLKISKVFVTHTHPDHVNGVADLLEKVPAKVYVHKNEAEYLSRACAPGLSSSDIIRVESGDKVSLGEVEVTFVHTPGHTPGSQCFLVENRLVSGDTLFIGSCGRTDLPGGNPEELYHSLTQRLMKLDERTILFPGHNYGDRPFSTIGDEKKQNPFMKLQDLRSFLQFIGY